MPVRSVEVECDISDFSDAEIEEEFFYRGLEVDGTGINIGSYSDEQLIQELEGRGMKIANKEDDIDYEDAINDLFYDLIEGQRDMIKLHKFFKKTIDKRYP